MSVTLDRAERYAGLGLCVIDLPEQTKTRTTSWAVYQRTRPSPDDLRHWFGNGQRHNAAIVLGGISGVAVIDTDTPEAEAWASTHLTPTPMMTRTAKGLHRYYRLPDGITDLPASVADTPRGVTIELRRDGHYVVAPGSIHPTGHVYAEVDPWPTSLDDVPLLPPRVLGDSDGAPSRRAPEPLPTLVTDGGRNSTLFREACRMRRLGWQQVEIAHALKTLNTTRCQPPLPPTELEQIAGSVMKYDAAPDTFPATEVGDAEFFVLHAGDTTRFNARTGQWLLFHDHHWQPDDTSEVFRLALDSIRARQRLAMSCADDARRRELATWALRGENRKRLTNLLAIAQQLQPIADAGDGWDADPYLLGVPNGVVDLRTGQRRDGRPEDRVTLQASVSYDAAARCPLWDATIAQVFCDDEELIAYFDRLVGYSITGDCREEVLALCFGVGANGKGTLMNTLAWVLGSYADDLPFSALELQDRGGIPNDIAKIVGKRFVTSSESAEARRLNEARVKALTGRDPITARFLHREFFTFQPVATFWLATNHKPQVRDTSAGFWRRVHLLPFLASFVDQPDMALKDKLRQEGPGILARAVRGCLAWQREGLAPPRAVLDATARYREESDPLARFIDERCVVAPDARATFGELFSAYVAWATATRETNRLTRREFSDALHAKFEVAPGKRLVRVMGIGLFSLVEGQQTEGSWNF